MKNEKVLRILDIETLETRGNDHLDFPEVNVASLRKALEYAYAEGKEEGYSDGYDVGHENGWEAAITRGFEE